MQIISMNLSVGRIFEKFLSLYFMRISMTWLQDFIDSLYNSTAGINVNYLLYAKRKKSVLHYLPFL